MRVDRTGGLQFVLPAVIAAIAAVAFSAQQPTRPVDGVCFVDEGPRDPTFTVFRERLREALRARDLVAFRQLIARDIAVTKSVRGVAGFERTYRLSSSATYWQELERSLSLPGKFLEPDWFCAPFFNCYGRGRDGYVTVLERDVPIMAEPRAQSTVLERVSCEEFRWAVNDKPVGGGGFGGWMAVLRPGGGLGFIDNRYVGDPELMFITMQKRDDQWMIVSVGPID